MLLPTVAKLCGYVPGDRIDCDPTPSNQEITAVPMVYCFPADAFLPRRPSSPTNEATFSESWSYNTTAGGLNTF